MAYSHAAARDETRGCHTRSCTQWATQKTCAQQSSSGPATSPAAPRRLGHPICAAATQARESFSSCAQEARAPRRHGARERSWRARTVTNQQRLALLRPKACCVRRGRDHRPSPHGDQLLLPRRRPESSGWFVDIARVASGRRSRRTAPRSASRRCGSCASRHGVETPAMDAEALRGCAAELPPLHYDEGLAQRKLPDRRRRLGRGERASHGQPAGDLKSDCFLMVFADAARGRRPQPADRRHHASGRPPSAHPARIRARTNLGRCAIIIA
eukprot:SAG11_NODE_2449_length_3349_cov_1.549846_3_plen_271_part_00